MKIIYYILGILFFSELPAQEFLSDIKKVQRKISENELTENLSGKESAAGINGIFFSPLMLNKEDICEEETKNPEYEVIAVVEVKGNTQTSSSIQVDKGYRSFGIENLEGEIKTAIGDEVVLEKDSILAAASRAVNAYAGRSIVLNPKNLAGRQGIIEAMIFAGSKSDINEKDLAKKLASMANEIFKTEEERMDFLTSLSSRLYDNYNTKRNPGKNSNNDRLPRGDISLNEILKGAAAFDKDLGGVCNDISESVAMIAENMFPDKDVLVVNGGAHFGVLIYDGKKKIIVERSRQVYMNDTLYVVDRTSFTNLRISKVVDGKLTDIAVVGTQMGQFSDSVFATKIPPLKTARDPQEVITSVTTLIKEGEKNSQKIIISGGMAQLSESKSYMIVAKYQHSSPGTKSYAGTGFSVNQFPEKQKFSSDLKESALTSYQLHLRSGFDQTIIQYVSDNASARFSTGIDAQTMIDFSMNNLIGYSAQVDWVTGLDLSYGQSDPHNVQVIGRAEARMTYSPKNWGDATGRMSNINPVGVLETIADTHFFLNQINADIIVDKRIADSIRAQGVGSYQGSSVGQAIRIAGVLTVELPAGAEILIFSGISTSKLPGYLTKNSMLVGQEGFEVGATLRSAEGVEFGGAVRGISSKNPSGEAYLKVPLEVPRRPSK